MSKFKVDPRIEEIVAGIDPAIKAEADRDFAKIRNAGGISKHVGMALLGIQFAQRSGLDDAIKVDMIQSCIRMAVFKSVMEMLKFVVSEQKKGEKLSTLLNVLSNNIADAGKKETETLANLMILVQDELVANLQKTSSTSS